MFHLGLAKTVLGVTDWDRLAFLRDFTWKFHSVESLVHRLECIGIKSYSVVPTTVQSLRAAGRGREMMPAKSSLVP